MELKRINGNTKLFEVCISLLSGNAIKTTDGTLFCLSTGLELCQLTETDEGEKLELVCNMCDFQLGDFVLFCAGVSNRNIHDIIVEWLKE